jgi:hypothetical protein
VAQATVNAGRDEMKRYEGIDYDFRPDTYWSAGDPLALILRHVKGTNRRQMIRDYWEAGALKALDDQLLKDTLTEAERQRLGRIHPSFMGGEYLPDFDIGEEEIVRVELESTTSDVISVRARPVPGGIAWRVVDEYPDSGEYVVKPQFSRGPLSLVELIGMLDGASYNGPFEGGLPLGWNINNLECGGGDAAEYRHFTTVGSSFYPELSAHYENVYDDWVEEHTPDGVRGGNDEDGEDEEEGEE